MRKLSEIKGEEALNVRAEISEPAAEMFTDEKVKNALKVENNKAKAAKIILKDHNKAVLTLMAALEGVPVEEYQPTLFALPSLILGVLNDPELNSLF